MKHLLLLLIFSQSFFLLGQEIDNPVTVLEKEGRKILEHQTYADRKAANGIFLQTLQDYLVTEKGFNDPLKSVNNMMRLELGKDARIYTWQMPDSNFKYVQFGVVAAEVGDEIVLTILEDHEPVADWQFKKLKPEDWYGAIYYEVIPLKKKRNKIYTILGYAPGYPVNRKIVDVIEIDRKGRPRFGDKVFKIDEFMDQTLRKPPMRLILSYGGDYSASVRWNDEQEKIIMDHLSPPDAKLKGVYQMYGPDMTYDALTWTDDWWHLETEVNFNTGQKIEIRPPDKPLDLPPDGKSKKIERN